MASNIVLADAQATPVNHTFVPIGRDGNDVFWFEDQSAANSIGFWRISVELKRPKPPTAGQSSGPDRTARTRVGLHEPILETVSNSTVAGIAPAPTVSYVPRSFSEFIVPERAALIDRKNLRKMMANLLAETQVTSVVENLVYLS